MAIEPAPSTKPEGYEFAYSDDPSDNSGYTLGQFVGIIQSGLASDYFDDYVKIKIVNTSDTISDNSIVLSLHSTKHFKLENSDDFAQTTWFMDGVLVQARLMNNTDTNKGGYLKSELDEWIEGTLYNALPYHWRSIIKPVTVLAGAGDMTQAISSGSRHLYLPSIAELGINVTTTPYSLEIDADANEKTFSYYSKNDQRIKKLWNGSGDATHYWTRSAHSGSNTNFFMIWSWGGHSEQGVNASYTDSVRVCVGFSI